MQARDQMHIEVHSNDRQRNAASSDLVAAAFGKAIDDLKDNRIVVYVFARNVAWGVCART